MEESRGEGWLRLVEQKEWEFVGEFGEGALLLAVHPNRVAIMERWQKGIRWKFRTVANYYGPDRKFDALNAATNKIRMAKRKGGGS